MGRVGDRRPIIKYNEDSGLIYEEHVVPVHRIARASKSTTYEPRLEWFFRPRRVRTQRTTTKRKKTRFNETTPSLLDLAWYKLLCNLPLLTPEAITALPDKMVESIWESIIKRSVWVATQLGRSVADTVIQGA